MRPRRRVLVLSLSPWPRAAFGPDDQANVHVVSGRSGRLRAGVQRDNVRLASLSPREESEPGGHGAEEAFYPRRESGFERVESIFRGVAP